MTKDFYNSCKELGMLGVIALREIEHRVGKFQSIKVLEIEHWVVDMLRNEFNRNLLQCVYADSIGYIMTNNIDELIEVLKTPGTEAYIYVTDDAYKISEREIKVFKIK